MDIARLRRRFAEFAARKTREAERATLAPLVTVEQRSRHGCDSIGNAWSRRLYDGDFYVCNPPPGPPAVSLVFVQSSEGNTAADNPEDLGGGATDKHLIYEGLSRVAASAVLAGASTAEGPNTFFSVWHPALVGLRSDLGLPRHPAQIVVSRRGNLDVGRTLLFNVPDVPVYVLAGPECEARCRNAFADRSWITGVPIDDGGLSGALQRLHAEHGITRISAVGGRTVATALLDDGLVQDLCLTTTARRGGVANTPYYAGSRPPVLDLIVSKRSTDAEAPIRVDQLAVSRRPAARGEKA